jgi:hypothetical protein
MPGAPCQFFLLLLVRWAIPYIVYIPPAPLLSSMGTVLVVEHHERRCFAWLRSHFSSASLQVRVCWKDGASAHPLHTKRTLFDARVFARLIFSVEQTQSELDHPPVGCLLSFGRRAQHDMMQRLPTIPPHLRYSIPLDEPGKRGQDDLGLRCARAWRKSDQLG